MTDNFNQLDPNQYPLPSVELPFSLEGHWQPWYDDRKDYNTNAPSYYDYLANFNKLYKDIVELLNRVARRNIKVEDTPCVDLTKVNDWIDEGNEGHTYHDVITLKADVILSNYQKVLNFDGGEYHLNNLITCLSDGLYSADYLQLLEHLKDKLNDEIRQRQEMDNYLDARINQERQDRDEGDQLVVNYVNEQFDILDNKIDKEIQDRKNADNALNAKIDKEIQDRQNADNDLNAKIDKEIQDRENANIAIKSAVYERINFLQTAIQKIVTNLYEGGNTTTNQLHNYEIINHIAAGNINLYGGTPDGNTLIKTHNGQAENDVTIGSKG